MSLSASQKKLLYEAVSIAVGLIIAFLPPPEGLTTHSMWVLGLLVWGIINWIARPMPDFLVILIMITMWAALKVLPFGVAFGAFSGGTIWLLISVFAISAAITKSGLLKRSSLLVMKLFPPTFKGQVLALMGTGLVVGPAIPSSMAKISIAGPMAAGIGNNLGFADKSKGMVGMFLAMYTGFSLLAPVFISASFFGYMIHGLMPEGVQQQFTWGYWFLSMIPWALVVVVLSYFAITKLYAPETPATMTKEAVNRQISELGPLSRDERVTAIVVGICVVFWILESVTGIPAVIPTIVGSVVLTALNVINIPDWNSKVPWHIIIFAGGVMGIAGALKSVGIVAWIETTFGPSLEVVAANPFIFVIAGSLLMFALRFVLVDHMTAFIMFIIIFSPFCIAVGMNPMIAGFVAYVNVMPFVVYYQNIQFVVAYEAFGGEAKIPFKKVMPYYFVFTGICIAGLLVSVPYWSALGLTSYLP